MRSNILVADHSTLAVKDFWFFIAIVLALTAIRIFYLAINHRLLGVEEAQYWIWSRHVAWGYHSKPPLIGWAIAGITHLFGNSEFVIRLLSPISYAITSTFVYCSAKTLFDEKTALWAGVIFILIPGVTFSATVMSTDPLLLIFWSAALFFFIKADQTGRSYWYLLCGISIGLGILAKYTMLVFVICLLLYGIFSKFGRKHFQRLPFYVMLLIMLLIFMPNLGWNYFHKDVTVHHVFYSNVNIHSFVMHFNHLVSFISSQFGLIGPILFFVLLMIFFTVKEIWTNRYFCLLNFFTYPLLLMICVEALLSRAYANWAVGAYIAGIIMVIAYILQHWGKGLLIATLVINVIVMMAFYTFELAKVSRLITTAHHKTSVPVVNWTKFAHQIRFEMHNKKGIHYLFANRDIWSQAAYYLKIPTNNIFIWQAMYKIDYFDNARAFHPRLHQNYLLIISSNFLRLHDKVKHNLFDRFVSFHKVGDYFISDNLYVKKPKRVRVYYLLKYKG